MKYIYLFIITLTIGSVESSAQNLSDALRFSITTPGGTARTIGSGGAFGALGGDFGSISINPAGLGTYRSSEFVISPGLRQHISRSIMRGTNTRTDTKEDYIGLENLGLVFSHTPIGSDWYSSNLAIGFNKVANFNRQFYYDGSTLGSITERFTFLADGLTPEQLDDFEAYPAYVTGAIYDFDEDQLYETDFFDNPDQQVRKNQSVEQRGSINELSLTWAGNYQNKVNIGFGIGIPFINYEEIKEYNEIDLDQEIDFFDRLRYTEFLNTSGTGFNLKGGVIFTPIKLLRLGLSVQSPTWIFVTDDYSTVITYGFTDSNGVQEFTESSPFGSFSYRFTTPWTFTASAGSIFSAGELQGFISADLEYKDYTQAQFNLTSNSSDPLDRSYSNELNQEIERQLSSATTLRLGTELAYNNLRLRGGVQIRQSVFEIDNNSTDMNYSLGLGLRSGRFFFDLGYITRLYEQGYTPYDSGNELRNQLVENTFEADDIVMTIGYKF